MANIIYNIVDIHDLPETNIDDGDSWLAIDIPGLGLRKIKKSILLAAVGGLPAYPNNGVRWRLIEENGVLSWVVDAGASGGQVDTVSASTGISVTGSAADVVVALSTGAIASLGKADTALQSLPTEEKIIGTALYEAVSGPHNLYLNNFSGKYLLLTGTTKLDTVNLPAVGDTFIRSLTVKSVATQALTLPAGWIVTGEYKATGVKNFFSINFTNYPTIGVEVICNIWQE